MQGYVNRPDPNRYASEKWVGKRVKYNGTEDIGTVEQAFWAGGPYPVNLVVNWPDNAARANHTDSEHVTIVRNVPTS